MNSAFRFISHFVVVFSLLLPGAAFSSPQKHIVKKIVKEKKGNGWLGVSIQDVSKDLAEEKELTATSGAYVDEVVEDSPAEKAGLREGDVIVKFDSKEIDDASALSEAVSETKPEKEVTIEIARGKERKSITATIEKPNERAQKSFTVVTPEHPKSFRFHFSTGDELQGLHFQELNEQLAAYFDAPNKRGVLITEVDEKSVAEKSGFKAGDVITKVDEDKVRDVEDIFDAVKEKKENEEASFTILRKGASQSIKMKIEEPDEYSENCCGDEEECNRMRFFKAPHHSFRWENFNGKLDGLRENLHKMKKKIEIKLDEL